MYLLRESTINARRAMSPRERIIDHQNRLNIWANVGLGIAVVIGFIVIHFHGGNRTTSIAAFGASLGAGGVLGFLFGIPSNSGKTLDPNGAGNSSPAVINPPPAPVAGSPIAANVDPAPMPRLSTSNLEQVADWVTKLLLGGGLTQMQHIPPKIWQWSHAVAVGIIGNNIGDNPNINERLILAQQGFACGLLVYGFILGFFAGFLITKLQLGKAIAE